MAEKIKTEVPYSESLAGRTTVREMASLLYHARFVVAPDTGPVHIASSFRKPVFGLYATSSTKFTGPYFSQDSVIDKYEEMKHLLLQQEKNCRSPRIYDTRAMSLISVEEVLKKIDLSLSTLK